MLYEGEELVESIGLGQYMNIPFRRTTWRPILLSVTNSNFVFSISLTSLELSVYKDCLKYVRTLG